MCKQELKSIKKVMNLEFIRSINYELKIDTYCSGNSMYFAQSTRNSAKAWIRKNPDVAKVQSEIADQVSPINDDVFAYEIHVDFEWSVSDWMVKNKSKLKRLDLTNLWKVFEDGLMTGLELDDSLCIKQVLCKTITEKDTPPYNVNIKIDLYKNNI